jgi:hypothetical protein
LDSLDSSRPELEGSHHLPPYIILCVTPRELHPNGTFSRDSKGGVPKLSRVELPGLWTLISPGFDLRLEWGLNQSCNSPRELSKASSHSFCRRWEEVDSQLLVVGSQTASLTPGPSFAHNLGCRCPNGSCEAILDIYTSRPFQRYKEHLKARCFALCCWALKLRESRRTPSSHFWECESHPHTLPKVGLQHQHTYKYISSLLFPSNVIIHIFKESPPFLTTNYQGIKCFRSSPKPFLILFLHKDTRFTLTPWK